jgi:hypothetical protein
MECHERPELEKYMDRNGGVCSLFSGWRSKDSLIQHLEQCHIDPGKVERQVMKFLGKDKKQKKKVRCYYCGNEFTDCINMNVLFMEDLVL